MVKLRSKSFCQQLLKTVFLLALLFLSHSTKMVDGSNEILGFSKQKITTNHTDSFLRGVSFTGFSEDAFLTAFSNQSLEQLAEDGGEWVAICFWWFVDDLNSSEFYPGLYWYSCNNQSIITA